MKDRTKKQQKYYRHLARQSQKYKASQGSTTNDTRQVVVREVKSVVKVVDNPTKSQSPTKTEQINSDDAISIHASDNDF